MSKADQYHLQAELCDQRAAEKKREVAELWRSIADQYRFLEAAERRVTDRWQLTESKPTEL